MVLRESVMLEGAVSLVRTIFSMFGIDTIGSFLGSQWKMIREEGRNGKNTEGNLTFVRTGFVSGGFVPSRPLRRRQMF